MPCLQLGEKGGSHGLVTVCQDQSEGEVLQKPGAAALLLPALQGATGTPCSPVLITLVSLQKGQPHLSPDGGGGQGA